MYALSPKDKDKWSDINTFISDFDGGYAVNPFEIDMEINNIPGRS